MTQEDQEFLERCKSFDSTATFEQYCADIERCLVLSSWHFSEESAKERVQNSISIIKDYWLRHEDPDSAAVDVGYSCG